MGQPLNARVMPFLGSSRGFEIALDGPRSPYRERAFFRFPKKRTSTTVRVRLQGCVFYVSRSRSARGAGRLTNRVTPTFYLECTARRRAAIELATWEI
jgi:hypothetical protein